MPSPLPHEAIAYSKWMAFLGIAEAQAETGNIDGALRTANAVAVLPEQTSREWFGGNPKLTILSVIANSQGKARKSEQALEWINGLTSPLEQTLALIGLAEGLLDEDRTQQ